MANSNLKRLAAGAFVVAGLVATQLIPEEGYEPVARPPIPGDRCTYGYGSTFHADGTPVKCGESITRQAASSLLTATGRDKYEAGLNACAGVIPLLPREKAILVRLAYQNGVAGVCGYSIIDHFRAGNYEAACRSITTISRLQGRNCALPQNRHRKDGCNGLMNRREKQMRQCLGLEPMEGIECTPNAAGQDSASPTAPLAQSGRDCHGCNFHRELMTWDSPSPSSSPAGPSSSPRLAVDGSPGACKVSGLTT